MTDKIVLGNENLINLPAQIDLAEVIIYSSTLPLADRNKIESYLAVKYGFTLNQSAGSNNDYVASNGSIIWNQLANTGYGADITGIGRDDASGLSQKQSRSINTSSLVTLYHGNYSSGNFPLLNNANTNNFSTDRSFLLAGDNGLPITLTPCFFENKAQRMQRIWKVNNTNVGTVTVSIDQAAVASAVKNLIRSADPGFPAATTDIIPLIAANGKLYAEVNFSNNDYFSFASDTISVTFSPVQPVCTNPNSGSVTTTVSGGNPPFGYAWSPSGQVTANLINVNAGTYNLTVTQGSCQAIYPITLAAPAAPTTPVVNPVGICSGNTATLNVQSPVATQTYSWYSVASGGTALGGGTSFTTPALTSNTTYYIETSSGSCTSNRVPVTVSITTVTDPVVNNAVVCTGNAATLTIQNPVAAQIYNWYNTATGGTALGTGTVYTTVGITAATVVYVEALNNGCSNPRIPVNVTIDNVTAPQATGDTVCAGSVATLFINNPDASLNYSWYDAPNAGTLIGNGVSVTTPVVSSETDFYVEAYNGNCFSSRISVTVRLTAPVQTPVVAVGIVTQNTVTFNWQGVPTAIGYQVSIDGGPFMNPSTGATGLSHTVSGLNTSQTVSIEVIALGPPTACGNSAPGIAQATTYGSGFHMPTAFTPNRDLSNPVIRPQLPGGSQLLFFTIYNRWGQKVFNTRIDGAGWDGSLNGKSQPDGAYVWVCRYVFTNGRIIEERGSFLLLH